MSGPIKQRVHGLCACGVSTFTAVLDGVRVLVERPPVAGGTLHVRFDLDQVTAVARGAVVDLTDPSDTGQRWSLHDCGASS